MATIIKPLQKHHQQFCYILNGKLLRAALVACTNLMVSALPGLLLINHIVLMCSDWVKVCGVVSSNSPNLIPLKQ